MALRRAIPASLFLFGVLAGCAGTSAPVDAASAADAGATTDTGAADVGATTDTGATTDAGSCDPQPTDLSSIDATCGAGTSACPSGYVCQAFSGAILTQSCQIPCEPGGCPCPATTACQMHSDKTAVPWYQCDPTP